MSTTGDSRIHGEQRLLGALEGAQVGLWEWSTVSKRVHLTAETIRILGLDKETFSGSVEELLSVVHPVDLSRIKAAFKLTAESGVLLEIDCQVSTDGTGTRVLAVRGRLENNQTTDDPKVVGVIADVSWREDHARQIRRQTRAYQLRSECNQALARAENEQELLSSICDIIVSVGQYRSAWIGFCDADGTESLRLVASSGIPDTMVDTFMQHSPLHGPAELSVTGRKPVIVQDVNVDPVFDTGGAPGAPVGPGSIIAIPLLVDDALLGSLSVLSHRNVGFDSGKVTRYMELGEDISQGITSQRSLVEIRRQAAVLDQSRDAIIVIDFDGIIREWHRGAEHVYGWTREEAVGVRLGVLWPDGDDTPLGSLVDQARSKGKWTGQFTQTKKDGTEIIVQSSWALLVDGTGEPESVLVLNSDITEHEVLQHQFRHAQRMESIGMLASGIAHDLNNVLGPIYIASDMLRDLTDNPEAPQFLDTIDRSVERGSEIIKQVLSFSQGTEGEPKAIHIEHVLTETIRFARETFPPGITILDELSDQLPRTKGDVTQLQQVILNLMVNAKDAMEDTGTLRVAAREVRLSEEDAWKLHNEAEEGSYLCISVSDTGSGIPEDIIDHVFEPFFTTKVRGKGTGLGLSAAQSIAQSHDGFVMCSSKVGEGSNFYLYLPVLEEPGYLEALPQKESYNLPTMPGQWVLVVDDEPSVRQTTQALLQSKGFHVVTANDGAEALALVVKHRDRFDLILTDMAMPIMDGSATILAIRKLNIQIPIIAMSGLLAPRVDRVIKEDPKVHFISKPFRGKQLLALITEIMPA